MWLGDDGYEGCLEICTYTHPGTQWRPVCGELWTNTEARLACKQLGYTHTTTLGKWPQPITVYVAITEVALLSSSVEQVNCAPRISVFVCILFQAIRGGLCSVPPDTQLVEE